MKLFKNVEIRELKSILTQGILPADELSEEFQWTNEGFGGRADNATDVVYLHKTLLEKENSFINYGFVLLEVEVEDAKENEMSKFDVNRDKYIEFVSGRISPEQIKSIYVPKMLRTKLNILEEIADRITFIDADLYVLDKEDFDRQEKEIKASLPKDLDVFTVIDIVRERRTMNYRAISAEEAEKIDLYDISKANYTI